MPRKIPVIQDKAVVALWDKGNPVGEALKKDDPRPTALMTKEAREEMLTRLDVSITELMDEAQSTHKANCYKPGTQDEDPEYMTRLSTNEFFFYTKEPLTLKEFEALQNKIAAKAKTLSPGVQLILGSFAVKTADNRVMNVTPHISCGDPPSVQFIVKNFTSNIDVRYKEPDGRGGVNTLRVVDQHNPIVRMPKIKVNGTSCQFTFNNIVKCKTPGGTPFLTAVDICVDHFRGVAKNNYRALVRRDRALLKQTVSHVVVSNHINLIRDKCLKANVLHVDPMFSDTSCKTDFLQKPGNLRKQTFGNGSFKIIDVEPEKLYQLRNIYAYQIKDPKTGRDHKSYTASITTIIQNPQMETQYKDFADKYKQYKGDYLKTKILEELKNKIQETDSKTELEELKKEIKSSYEYQVLKTAQGWFTQTFGTKTSSVKALENMFKQQQEYLSGSSPKMK